MLNYSEMSLKKNILILYITERSGHHSAALALKKAFEITDPEANVTCINAFRYFFPRTEKLTHIIYLFVIKRFPVIWKAIYDRPSLVKKTGAIKSFIHNLARRKLKKMLSQFHPDAVICTQAFPCGILADYKRDYDSSVKLFGVLTDFSPHSYWIYDDVDGYFVGSEMTKQWLVSRGVKEWKIFITGIPIDPKFSLPFNADEIRMNYGLDEHLPAVLLMGGGHGLGPIKLILKDLDTCGIPMQFIVVCGINNKLYRWLIRRHFNNRLLAFKYTDEIHRLMSVANLIITKPGGITTAEALSKKLPMVILNPIPGQETRNTELLKSQKAAVRATVEDIEQVVSRILSDPSKVDSMKKAIVSAGLDKPKASVDIARHVLAGI